jgi:transcription elongation factor Elf1
VGRVWPYYSTWRDEQFACNHCGWTGKVGSQDLEVGDAAALIECRKCYSSLDVVVYPNLQETKDAAALGNDEAIKALPSFASRVEHNRALLNRFEKEKLRSADQLPNLGGILWSSSGTFKKEMTESGIR